MLASWGAWIWKSRVQLALSGKIGLEFHVAIATHTYPKKLWNYWVEQRVTVLPSVNSTGTGDWLFFPHLALWHHHHLLTSFHASLMMLWSLSLCSDHVFFFSGHVFTHEVWMWNVPCKLMGLCSEQLVRTVGTGYRTFRRRCLEGEGMSLGWAFRFYLPAPHPFQSLLWASSTMWQVVSCFCCCDFSAMMTVSVLEL